MEQHDSSRWDRLIDRMEQHNIINRFVPDSPYPSPHSGEFVMYSDGVAKVSASKLEFITLKITNRADINGYITDLFNYLAELLIDGNEVRPYDHVTFNNVRYMIIPIGEMERNVILNTHMYAYGCKRDRNTNKVVSRYASSEGMNLLLVMPLSELPFTYLLPKTSPYSRSRTGREAVIGEGTEVVFGEKAMKVHTIQEKWPASQVVTRHIDGNRRNNHCTNLQRVSLYDAFTHAEWEDGGWESYLEENEIEFVRENMDLFAEIFRPASNNVRSSSYSASDSTGFR